MNTNYLSPEDDGLPMRQSGDYAKDKLRILKNYVDKFIVSMRGKPWRAMYYLDLQAGPGKNVFSPSKEVMLGSPLIALTAPHPFTHYRFVELDSQNAQALERRISQSPYKDRVQVVQGNCNIVVDEIAREIASLDKSYIEGRWPSLNLAFLDPEGLELEWQTVEKLGRMNRMDLIINFSLSGVTRNAKQIMERDSLSRLDKFFGTLEWREIYKSVMDKDNTHIRRTMLDYYKNRLGQLGYRVAKEDEYRDERVFRNRKNVQIYTLIAASKHDLGVKFWQDTIEDAPSQPRLF